MRTQRATVAPVYNSMTERRGNAELPDTVNDFTCRKRTDRSYFDGKDGYKLSSDCYCVREQISRGDDRSS